MRFCNRRLASWACPRINSNQATQGFQGTTCRPQPTCAPGLYQADKTKKARAPACKACDMGQYQTLTVAAIYTCMPQPKCKAGQYLDIGGSALSKQKGVCKPCAVAKYRVLEAGKPYVHITACTPHKVCPRGQRREGNSETKAEDCVPCGANEYQSIDEYDGITCGKQTACNAGEKSVDLNTTKTSYCVSCEALHYQASASHFSEKCIPQASCGKGQKLSGISKKVKETCGDCPSNTYQGVSGFQGTSCKSQPTCSLADQQLVGDSAKQEGVCSICWNSTSAKLATDRTQESSVRA